MVKTTDKELLIIDPAEELVLKGPFNRAVCRKLSFFNPSKDGRVSFKIKTTSPRIFSVRPNVGMVEPEQVVAIDIFVHPIVQDSLAQARHKFLIQAAEASKHVTDVQEFWKSKDSDSIWETKIKLKLIEAGAEQKIDYGTNSPKESTVEQVDHGDNSDPLAKLMKQVSIMEEERLDLLQKVQELTKEMEQNAKSPKMAAPEKLWLIFTIVAIMFALGAAICTKN